MIRMNHMESLADIIIEKEVHMNRDEKVKDKMEYVAIQRLVEIDLVVLEYSDIIVKPVEEQKTMTAFVEARTELEELTELLRRSSSWGTSTVSSSS